MQAVVDADEPTPARAGQPHLAVHIHQKSFVVQGTSRQVMHNLHFEVESGEFVSLLGPSGCGKTTLLRMIAGLERPDAGHLSVAGRPVDAPGPDRGIVFQEARLFPWMTVEQNVRFALPAAQRQQPGRLEEVLRLVGLTDFRGAWPYQLSGGMEKRVALARALVNVPQLLLLDEPYAALDTLTKFTLQEELMRVHVTEGITSILVTHDIDEAVYLSDRVLLLSPSPATIRTIYPIPLPRPRDRASDAFGRVRMAILDALLQHR